MKSSSRRAEKTKELTRLAKKKVTYVGRVYCPVHSQESRDLQPAMELVLQSAQRRYPLLGTYYHVQLDGGLMNCYVAFPRSAREEIRNCLDRQYEVSRA